MKKTMPSKAGVYAVYVKGSKIPLIVKYSKRQFTRNITVSALGEGSWTETETVTGDVVSWISLAPNLMNQV